MNKKKNNTASISLTMSVEQSEFPVEIAENEIRVNLSKMGEPFGPNKRPSNWLRTKEAKTYIDILSDAHICASADLMEVINAIMKLKGYKMEEVYEVMKVKSDKKW